MANTEDGFTWLNEGSGWMGEEGTIWLDRVRGIVNVPVPTDMPKGWQWLTTEDGKKWLKSDSGIEWLKSEGGKIWIKTIGIRRLAGQQKSWLRERGWKWFVSKLGGKPEAAQEYFGEKCLLNSRSWRGRKAKGEGGRPVKERAVAAKQEII